MNCWRVQNLLAPFVEGELQDGESRAVAEHIEDCGHCRDAVDAVASIPDLTAPTLPTDHCTRIADALERTVLDRIRSSAPSPNHAIRKAWWRGEFRVPASVAASLALAFGGLGALHFQTQARLAVLEKQTREREDLLVRLQARLTEDAASPWRLATVPSAPGGGQWAPLEVDTVGLPVTSGWPQLSSVGSSAGGTAPFQLVSAGGPRVVR